MASENELLATALAAADAAADIHRRYRGRLHAGDARRKGPSDFVSHVDLEAEEAALRVIRESFPDHRILAEEESAEGNAGGGRDDPGPAWIVDPLDGTTNFLHGHPMFASSVGVVQRGEAIAGAVVAAATEERWWAAKGSGAYRNGERIRTSDVRDLEGALVGTGFPFRRPEELDDYLADFRKVFPRATGIRRGGSAALDLCYLAQGSLDAFWEGQLAPWDIAAGCAILAESGGACSRVDRTPIDFVSPGSVLAGNSEALLEALAAVLSG